jgi:Flp pilus assembly protein TadG
MSLGGRRPRGQALVELALIIPVLVFIVFGITDIGRAYYQYTTMTEAVREGARYAAVNWSNSSGGGSATNSNAASAPFNTTQGRIQYVGRTAGMTFLNDASHIAVTYYDGTDPSLTQCAHWDAATNNVVLDNSYTSTHPRTGDLIKVRLDYTFKPLVPIVSQVTGAAFNLTAIVEVRVE